MVAGLLPDEIRVVSRVYRGRRAAVDRLRRVHAARDPQLMHERAMFAPILEPALLTGVGPRMGEVPTIAGHPYFSPYEDLKLKGR